MLEAEQIAGTKALGCVPLRVSEDHLLGPEDLGPRRFTFSHCTLYVQYK